MGSQPWLGHGNNLTTYQRQFFNLQAKDSPRQQYNTLPGPELSISISCLQYVCICLGCVLCSTSNLNVLAPAPPLSEMPFVMQNFFLIQPENWFLGKAGYFQHLLHIHFLYIIIDL